MSATISPAAPPTSPAAKKPTDHVLLVWVGFVLASLLALDLLSLTVWSIAVPLAAATLWLVSAGWWRSPSIRLPGTLDQRDLAVIAAQVFAEHVRHIDVAELGNCTPRQRHVEVVVQLISRLDDAGLDARAIDARGQRASAPWTAIAIRIRCRIDFSFTHPATMRPSHHIRLQCCRGATHGGREYRQIRLLPALHGLLLHRRGAGYNV